MKDTLITFLKKRIVVDTRSSLFYIGTLEEVLNGCIVLSDVDVHDGSETATSKEKYVMDSLVSGVKANREAVYVNLEYIVSFSLLADVKKF